MRDAIAHGHPKVSGTMIYPTDKITVYLKKLTYLIYVACVQNRQEIFLPQRGCVKPTQQGGGRSQDAFGISISFCELWRMCGLFWVLGRHL